MEHEITAQPVYNKKGQIISAIIKLSNSNLVAGKKYKIIISWN